MRSKIFWWVLFAAAISFFAVSVSTRADVPAAQDELCWLGGVDSLHETGTAWDVYNPGEKIVYSPHLYLRLLELSYAIFGPSLSSARWPGLFAGLISLALVCAITMRVVEGDRRRRWGFGVMATLFCCSIPAFVQGCAIIDIDNTILGPLLLAMVWTGQRLTERSTWSRALALAGVTALVLWARFTTPLILFPILALFAGFASDRRARWSLPLALIAGVGIFLATWGAYCVATATPFWGPFAYTWAAFADRAGGGTGRLGVERLAANGSHLAL
ncbi:MAG: glycosyltransferase family 39 protein, partial [Planctomycetota bacterium]